MYHCFVAVKGHHETYRRKYLIGTLFMVSDDETLTLMAGSRHGIRPLAENLYLINKPKAEKKETWYEILKPKAHPQ